MHELFIVSSYTQKQHHLLSCIMSRTMLIFSPDDLYLLCPHRVGKGRRAKMGSSSIAVQCACNTNVLFRRPHPSMQVNSCSISKLLWQFSRSARTLTLPPDYDKEQTLSLASLKALWPAEQANWNNARRFAPFIWEYISIATLVCAHGTAILTNCGPSELVAERIFYALQVRTRTII